LWIRIASVLKEKLVADMIKTPTILINESALLPKFMHIESSYVPDWKLVKDFGGDVSNREIQGTDWTFVR